MHFHRTELEHVWLITPSPALDTRGHFMRAWCRREFAEHGIDFHPLQANMVLSVRTGTVRGMHFQLHPAQEAKLVRCTRGRLFDVALDLRPGSRTYGNWYGAELSASDGQMLYVPEGCAHGFQTLEDQTEMHYMTSAYYEPDVARGVRYDDPAFGISWPIETMVLSDQDRSWPLIQEGG